MNRPRYYILRGHDPIPCDDLMEWASNFEVGYRRVAHDRFMADSGDWIRVSTVFLGLDHNYWDTGEPILFETMVFGGVLDEYMWRYCTWEEAEEGHALALKLARTTEVLDDAQTDQLAAQVLARYRGKKVI